MIVVSSHNKKNKANIQAITPKVLLVEDEPILQQVHFLMLKALGCCVNVVETGARALASAVCHYDIIFMDVGLPDLRGPEVTAKIRESNFITNKTPIIMLTAYPKSEIEEECFSAGANKILNKPVTSEEFRKVLKQYHHLFYLRDNPV